MIYLETKKSDQDFLLDKVIYLSNRIQKLEKLVMDTVGSLENLAEALNKDIKKEDD